MRPVIIALGRSDNHAFVAAHARSLGVEYLAIEGFEASDLIHNAGALEQRFAQRCQGRAPIVAVIDSSIAPSTFRSFVHALDALPGISPLVRTEPDSFTSRDFTSRDFTSSEERSGDRQERIINFSADSSRGILALSIARSPHGQVAIWPILKIELDGSARPLLPAASLSEGLDLDALITRLTREVGEREVVGALTYFIDPVTGEVIGEEYGVAKVAIWSESACYTAISEQIVRAILDLPLGDTRLIDFEEFYLREEVELGPGTISDPIRPFLHLFARNPRLKVSYPAHDDWNHCTLSLFASSEQEALIEMAHARDFMLGVDD